MSDTWVERKRPPHLERRIEFADYEQTREFLEKAAELAEREGYYPDVSFGRTHVSISLHPRNEGEEVGEELHRYAGMLDALVPPAQSDE